MKAIHCLSLFATTVLISGTTATASWAQQAASSSGFTFNDAGGVTSAVISEASSDTFAFSSAVSNDGGVFTQAFSSSFDPSSYIDEAISAPPGIASGTAVSPSGVGSGNGVVSIQYPGGSIEIGTP